MLAHFRQALIRTLLLTYFASACLGYGLHALPGCDHASCSGGHVTSACASDHDDHDHATENTCEPSHTVLVRSADDCSICRFQAAGQLASLPTVVDWPPQCLSYSTPRPAVHPVSDARAAFLPRGPPQA